MKSERATPRNLARLLCSAIGAGDVSVVVDLGDRDDASSELLTVLHRSARHLRGLGGTLAIVARHPGLRRLFDLTAVSQTLPVYATRDEALRAWS